MQETAQYFEKKFFFKNRSKIFIGPSKCFATHGNYVLNFVKITGP